MSDVIGGLERANRGAALEAGLRRGGDGKCRFWGSDEATMLSWVGLCLRPRAEASGESEVFRDLLCERPRMKRGDGLVCSHVLLEAQQGRI
jgi:hypothetical protein